MSTSEQPPPGRRPYAKMQFLDQVYRVPVVGPICVWPRQNDRFGLPIVLDPLRDGPQ